MDRPGPQSHILRNDRSPPGEDFSSYSTADLIEEAKREKWVDSDSLAEDWLEEEVGGEVKYILNHVKAEAGWTATQVWGFQMVGGERRYVRNVVVAKGDKFISFKMIYDFIEG